MRRRRRGLSLPDDRLEIALSPLIDCVFLLLIFFLVTTMLKRKEKLLPIRLPDQTSAVSKQPRDATLVIGLSADGQSSRPQANSGRDGEIIYEPVGDLSEYLKTLIDEQGSAVFSRPLRIDCDRQTPFQVAIEALDTCKLLGFRDVGLRTKGGQP